MAKQKKTFSLLEVLIVMALVSAVFSVILVRSHRMTKDYFAKVVKMTISQHVDQTHLECAQKLPELLENTELDKLNMSFTLPPITIHPLHKRAIVIGRECALKSSPSKIKHGSQVCALISLKCHFQQNNQTRFTSSYSYLVEIKSKKILQKNSITPHVAKK